MLSFETLDGSIGSTFWDSIWPPRQDLHGFAEAELRQDRVEQLQGRVDKKLCELLMDEQFAIGNFDQTIEVGKLVGHLPRECDGEEWVPSSLHQARRRRDSCVHRRYRLIPITNEPEAQVSRLRYLLANGCKEGLVRKPADWPGASGLLGLLKGVPIVGHWFNRTLEYRARRRRL